MNIAQKSKIKASFFYTYTLPDADFSFVDNKVDIPEMTVVFSNSLHICLEILFL